MVEGGMYGVALYKQLLFGLVEGTVKLLRKGLSRFAYGRLNVAFIFYVFKLIVGDFVFGNGRKGISLGIQ